MLKPTEDTGLFSASGSFMPRNFDEWTKLCSMIADSSLCPTQFKGKPGDVFVACQMGSDLGLKPMQALQNIAVINGRPCLWGDAALAVVRAHPDFSNIEESLEGDTATCVIHRKGQSPTSKSFSRADAETAKLWGKPGPWTQYPTRMLQMRARGFAMRDSFPDALKGINIAEEVMDFEVSSDGAYGIVEKTHPVRKSSPFPMRHIKIERSDFDELKQKINEASTFEGLDILVPALQFFIGNKHEKDDLRRMFQQKKYAIKVKEAEEATAEKTGESL